MEDLAIVMAVSTVIMIFCSRFHLPVVLGYILAGLLIGPHTPPYAFVHDLQSIHTLSELGIIFLLFSIGLEFSLKRLAHVGWVSLFAAALEIALMICIGYALGRSFGWNPMNSVFLGAILSISSTTIIAKLLMEMKKIKEEFAQIILGILIIEDVLAIVIIALLSGLASTGSLEWGGIGAAMLRVTLFIAGVLFFGFLAVPRLLRYVRRFDSDEMLIITVLGLCFGVSLLAAKFGCSVALGAFLIGVIIAETRYAEQIVHKIEPLRDMFTAIFFVSVGMLLDPQAVFQYRWPILIITLVTIVGKVASCSLGTFLTGYAPKTALKVGLGLAQIGEFSFVIAGLGESSRVTSSFMYPVAVTVSGITTLTTPFLMKNTDRIVRLLVWVTPRPLVTFFGLYTGWLSRLGQGQSPGREVLQRVIRRYGLHFFIYAFGAGTLYYALKWAQQALGSGDRPLWPLTITAAVVLLGAMLFFWSSVKKLHDRIEQLILSALDQEKISEKPQIENAKAELLQLIREKYPWEVTTEDVLLPYEQSSVNVPIRDLRLRSETGASIIAIYRGEESIANPPPNMKLLPGDVLLLMGDAKQIKSAIVYLNKKMKDV